MQLWDFFIECAQSEMKIEMSRKFLISLPTYHPQLAFQEISNKYNSITAKSLSDFLIKQGLENSEQECQMLIHQQMKYESFLKLILPIDTQISFSESNFTLNEEAKFQLSKHFNLHISLLKILQPPLHHFSGTIEQVGEFFRNNLQFISAKELKLIQRFLDYEETGIIDTKLPFQVSLQIPQQLGQLLSQQKVNSGISDMKDKDAVILPVNSPLIVLVSILKKELRLSLIRKRLYNNENFNLLLAFQQVDQSKGFITMKDYDDYLNQSYGTSKYLFRNTNQIDRNYFKELFKPQLRNELPEPKCPKTNINFRPQFKEYLQILQIPPSKINNTSNLNIELENIASRKKIEAQLRKKGYNYTTEEINLLFQKQYIRDSNVKTFILQNTITI